ncbi:MAG: AAA family ATPase [Candidatus Eremiobacterota bacterium]
MAELVRFFRDPEVSFFLFGPRGTGKSTWLRQQLPDAVYLDLLDPETARPLEARPERLKSILTPLRGSGTVVLDEIQRVPELLTVVHQLIERHKSLRFVLTGSSARKLKRSGVDLLGGRALLCRMHPFMGAELGGRFDLAEAVRRGTLPLVVDSPVPDRVLNGYVGLYLREEVQQEGLVRNIGSFSRFLEAITLSHGACLNVSEVARECEVSRKTVEGYVEVVEDLLLSFRLPVFTRRARRQLAAHPKFYWFDAGVFQSLRPRGPLDSGPEIAGAALEGLVAQHLRAWSDLSGGNASLSYWRTRAGNEVDFVVYGPDGFWALEVKSGATLHPRDLSGLKGFTQDYPEARPILLYGGKQTLEVEGILCLPVEDFLLALRPGTALA